MVSKDLLHWARLDVALWADQPYDSSDVFSGSATVVNGSVYIMYPGLFPGGTITSLHHHGYHQCYHHCTIPAPSLQRDDFFGVWKSTQETGDGAVIVQ